MNDIDKLYREIQPNIYAFIYVKTLNRDAAEDLTQEVFYEAIKGFNSFQGKCSIQTWLFSIAKNLLKKHYRSRKYSENLTKKIIAEDTKIISPEEQAILNEERDKLLKLINELDDISKEIVMLRVYGELSFSEIGVLIDRTENYARVTFYRAKLKLQRELEGYNG
jgi:RNA polymerase sigma-70 factor (ECF subfamily)